MQCREIAISNACFVFHVLIYVSFVCREFNILFFQHGISYLVSWYFSKHPHLHYHKPSQKIVNRSILKPSNLLKFKNIALHLSKISQINNFLYLTFIKRNLHHQTMLLLYFHHCYSHSHLYNPRIHFYTTLTLHKQMHKTLHQRLLLDMLFHYHLTINVVYPFFLFLLM